MPAPYLALAPVSRVTKFIVKTAYRMQLINLAICRTGALPAWILAFVAPFLGPLAVLADPVQIDDHRPVLLGKELYTEGWDQYFLFDDGAFLAVQLLISNFGPTDHRALVIGTLLPADGGEPLIIKNGRGRKDWSFDDHELDLRVARHRFSGAHPHYRLYMGNSRGEIELTLQASVETWRPGRVPDSGGEKYHYASFLMPQAEARGRFRRGSQSRGDLQPWRTLSNGRGFAVRHVNSSSLARVARTWIRLAPLETPTASAPVFYLVQRPDAEPAVFLAVVGGGRIQRQWSQLPVTLTASDNAGGTEGQLPETVRWEKMVAGGVLKGKISFTRLLQRFDPIQELKPIERLFVRLLNTPTHHRYLAHYELSYPGEDGERRLRGSALAEVMTLRRR